MSLQPASNQPQAAADSGDRCPRCGGAFHCGMHDAAPCACTTLTLATATLDDLRDRYAGCVCLRCLTAIAAGASVEPPVPD